MNYAVFFSDLELVDAIGALIITILYSKDQKHKSLEDRIFIAFALSSTIWSFGFFMLILQDNATAAHVCRCIAIAGTVSYMITSQMLLSRISMISVKKQNRMNGVALLGIPVYIISMAPSQTAYYISKLGMTYSFKPGVISYIYTGYFLIVSFDILGVIIYMITKPEYKRIRSFGIKFLFVSLLVIAGTILDMIFPTLGLDALPGSSITQFWGLLIVNSAMIAHNKNLINAENMSEYIYSSLKDPILIFGEDSTLRVVNGAAKDVWGIYETDIIMKRTLFDLFESNDGKTEIASDEAYASFDGVCKVNKKPCNCSISSIVNSYGDFLGYIAVIKDRSERVRYINALKDARQAADTANKAKSAFLANMSHEIRTPMNAIIGFSEIILKEDVPKEEMLDYVGNIRDSSYGLLSLINDILDISKIESGKMELVIDKYDLKLLIKNVIAQLKPLADKKNLEFRIDVDKNVPRWLEGDSTKIKEIITNLCSNAIKYTKEGFLALHLKYKESERPDIVMLELAVEDSGMGIEKDKQQLVFEAFEQVDKKINKGIQGTGLGLAIVKGYVTLMKGTITVDSEVGKGSVFSVEISQKVLEDEKIGSLASSGEEHRKSDIGNIRFDGIKVLAVDDNRVNLKVISKILQIYGFTVDVADSGEKALAMCEHTEYPIVFMDQMMPEMDGVQAMHLLRDSSEYYRFTSKIIALTANAVSEAKAELLNEGFDEYLKKPIEYDKLEAVLTKFAK